MAATSTRRARIAVLLVVASLVAGEVLLRATADLRSLAQTPDPELGWLLRPNFDGRLEGARVQTNSDGFRGPEWSAPEDGGQPEPTGDVPLRIAVLGDSVAFGFGVEHEELFAVQLEARLAASLGEGRVEVRNFALPGKCWTQMRAIHDRYVAPWQPDVVVAMLNDASHRPPMPIEPRTWSDALLAESALHAAWEASLELGPKLELWSAPPVRSPAWRRSYDCQRFPFALRNREPFVAMTEDLARLRGQLAERGSQLLLVALPQQAHFREHPDRRLGLFFQKHAGQLELALIDPAVRFRAWARTASASPAARAANAAGPEPTFGRELFLAHDPDHWSPAAHALMADVVSETLLTRQEP